MDTKKLRMDQLSIQTEISYLLALNDLNVIFVKAIAVLFAVQILQMLHLTMST